MKKQLLISALTLGILSSSTVLAAENPFTTVPKDHWAYQAVEQLVQDGLIDGYGDNDFRGERNMTRYESAQLLAKAMTNIDKANEADKAAIARLQQEYADELRSFEVRLSNVEKKASSFKWTGDARIRYQTNYNGDMVNGRRTEWMNGRTNDGATNSSRIQERIGLNIEGSPAENLTVLGRLTAEDTLNESNGLGNSHVDTTHRSFYLNRAELDWRAKNGVTIDVGRMTKSIGQGLIWWENPMDGFSVEKSFAGDKAKAMIGWADINPGISYYNSNTSTQMGFFADLRAKVTPSVEVSLGYLHTNSDSYVPNYLVYGNTTYYSTSNSTWAAQRTRYQMGQLALGIHAKLAPKLSVTMEGVRNSGGATETSYENGAWRDKDNTSKNGFWTRVAYGDQELKKARNYNVYIDYLALGGLAVDSTGFAHRLNVSGGDGYGGNGMRGWGLGANYMVSDNANLGISWYRMKAYDENAAWFSDGYKSILNTTLNFTF